MPSCIRITITRTKTLAHEHLPLNKYPIETMHRTITPAGQIPIGQLYLGQVPRTTIPWIIIII